MPLESVPSPPWRRLAAAAIDLPLLMAMVTAGMYLLVFVNNGQLQAWLFRTANPWLTYGYILLTVSFVPYSLYFGLQEGSGRGATVGKRLLGLRVTTASGDAATVPRAILRTAVKFLPWEIGHVAIVFLTRVSMTGLKQDGFPFTPDTQLVTAATPWALPVQVFALCLLAILVASVLGGKNGRGAHDRLAGTRVVWAERPVSSQGRLARRPYDSMNR